MKEPKSPKVQLNFRAFEINHIIILCILLAMGSDYNRNNITHISFRQRSWWNPFYYWSIASFM